MMYALALAVKRVLRSVYFPVLLFVLTLSLIASVSLGQSEELPLAGVCDLDGSAASARVALYLTENHFEVCENEDELRRRISAGEYNCGVVLPDGFEKRLQTGDTEGAVPFISSPTSFVLAVYKNHAAAAIFSEYAPFLSAAALKDTDISQEEVIKTYRDMMDGGLLFSFDIEYVEASFAPEDTRARTYAMTASAVLIFVMLMYSACELLTKDMAELPHRVGMKATLLYAVIPGMAVRAAGILLAAAIAAVVSFFAHASTALAELLLPIFAYTLAVTALAMLTAALFRDAGKIRIFTFFILLASFVLCPVYIDAALLVPLLKYLRLFVAPCWLWLCADAPWLVFLAAAAVPLSFAALYARFVHRAVR